MSIDLLAAILGLLFTLMIFSYLLGDNPLFRVAVYIFIGVSSGYAATVVCYQVLSPKLLDPLRTGDPNQLLLTMIPLFLSISLLAKLTPRISWIGNFAMAVLVGVGAAAALGGALLGTLIPQAQAAMDAFDFRSAPTTSDAFFGLLNGIVMLAGTVFTLGYFHFSAERAADGTPRRNRVFELIAWVGRIFIAITLGVLFAGVYMSALTAMIERLSFIINFFRQFLGI
ncbi:MAG: hypothetical protein ACXW4U_04295 [Anaerolineales bacterium]